MKREIKYTGLFSQKLEVITISEELNQLKGKILAPRKLEDANKILRKLNHSSLSKLKNPDSLK